jgi:hypothetical protein
MRANYNARPCAGWGKVAEARTMEKQWKKQCGEQSQQSGMRLASDIRVDAAASQ